MAGAATIIIKQDPVQLYERFLWTLSKQRGDFYGYDDDDRAMGGYWSSSFKIRAPKLYLQDFFENGLGRHVEIYGYGMECLHEGRVWEMVYNHPPDKYTVSLQNVINSIFMRADYDDDGEPERSTVLENTDSQARYGTIERSLGGGVLDSLVVADQATQQFIDWRGWPKSNFDLGKGRGEPYLEIFSKGYIHMTGLVAYNQTVETGTQGLSAEFEDVFTSSEYVAKITISTNSTPVEREQDSDRRPMDIGFDLARLGDSGNKRWIAFMKKGRELVLAPATPAEAPVVL